MKYIIEIRFYSTFKLVESAVEVLRKENGVPRVIDVVDVTV